MFQDDINRSSFNTSYSTKIFICTLLVSNNVIIIACESSDNRKVKLINACESVINTSHR